MRYTVIWLPDALKELARIWMQAPDQQAVADAANRIDSLLRTAPDRWGQPYDGDWILEVPPLTVVYEIDPGDCKVTIIQVWHE